MATTQHGVPSDHPCRRSVMTGLALLPLALASCRFPTDPEGTLARVSGGTMRVGAPDAAPWVVWRGEEAEGIEVALARAFAAECDARVAWHRGGELRAALEEGALDLLVGDLRQDDPWRTRLAFTRPYLEIPVLVVDPSGQHLTEIDGIDVAVPAASPLGAEVAAHGGRPVAGGDPDAMAAARPAWNSEPGGTGEALVLTTQRHVMAVRQGENAWLLALERSLERHRGAVLRQALAEAAT